MAKRQGTLQNIYLLAAELATANPILLAGEPAFERDTRRLKVGDGVTLYNDLPYWGGGTPLFKEILSSDSRLTKPTADILRLAWDPELVTLFGSSIRMVMFLYKDAANSPYKHYTGVQPIYNTDNQGNVTSIDFEGVTQFVYFKLFITGIDGLGTSDVPGTGNGSPGISAFSQLQGDPTDNSALATIFDNLSNDISGKVDKVNGQGLSDNNYTTVEKNKLAQQSGTNTGDQDLSNLVVKVSGKGLSTNDYTTLEKNKLAQQSGVNTGDQDISGIATNTAAINAINNSKGQANGIAPLDADSKVPAIYLPSYVDDVLEFASYAALPATGETGKIYITLNDNSEYRWSGSVYVQLVASPGSTDAVPEGATNKYFTNARVASYITGTGKQLSTNDYTTNEQIKLAGIATGATANSTDAQLRDRSTHTGTQSADSITDGTTNKAYTATEKTKLAAITGTNTGDQDLSNLVVKVPGKGLSTNDFDNIYKARVDALLNYAYTIYFTNPKSDCDDYFRIARSIKRITLVSGVATYSYSLDGGTTYTTPTLPLMANIAIPAGTIVNHKIIYATGAIRGTVDIELV